MYTSVAISGIIAFVERGFLFGSGIFYNRVRLFLTGPEETVFLGAVAVEGATHAFFAGSCFPLSSLVEASSFGFA